MNTVQVKYTFMVSLFSLHHLVQFIWGSMKYCCISYKLLIFNAFLLTPCQGPGLPVEPPAGWPVVVFVGSAVRCCLLSNPAVAGSIPSATPLLSPLLQDRYVPGTGSSSHTTTIRLSNVSILIFYEKELFFIEKELNVNFPRSIHTKRALQT